MKPQVEYEILKQASNLEVWDVRVFGVDREGEPFEKVLNFEVPVHIDDVARYLAMWNSNELQ